MTNLLSRLALAAMLLGCGAGNALAVGCQDPEFHWRSAATGGPQVNVRHVFCGEIKSGGKVVGYHSTQVPSDVVARRTNIRNQDDGLYDATPVFTNGKTKMSTFYPDTCSYRQILASILYAAAHEEGKVQPFGAVGPSAPDDDKADIQYCRLTSGKAFKIRFAWLDDTRKTRINTAFPHR